MLVADSMFADLHQCYRQGFSFPDWCLTPEYEKVHSSVCKRVRLIGPKNGHRMAQCMIYQRQPVNIAMSTHGTNKAKFESFQTRYLTELSPCVPKVSLPWTESLYTAYYEQYGTLLPNVAVYCETPVGIAKPLWKKVIRVLNLIGLAFDNSKQPDLRAYDAWKGQNADKNASLWLRPRVRAQLKNVGAVLNWASSDKKITYVHLPAVGCGAFAGDMPVLSVWNDELALAVADWKDAHKDLIIDSGEIYPGTFHAGLQMTRVWDDLDKRYGLDKCLFVNAWDPHSFIGNGNAMDPSLDGYYGRHTAMALLGWPGTNRLLFEQSHYIARNDQKEQLLRVFVTTRDSTLRHVADVTINSKVRLMHAPRSTPAAVKTINRAICGDIGAMTCGLSGCVRSQVKAGWQLKSYREADFSSVMFCVIPLRQGACFGVLQQSSKGHRLLGYFAGANQKIFRPRITRITARLYKEFEKWKATQWRLEPKGPLRFGV